MRIAIVNSKLPGIEAVRRALTVGGHKLAWVAQDGAEAVELCGRDVPDLILMDLVMPRMDGVEATRRIMARTPCAIVIVTANVNSHSAKVFEAMGAGALDAVNTPVHDQSGSDGSAALLAKIGTIARLLGRSARKKSADSPAPSSTSDQLVAIGASAGGPAALAKILSVLPANFPAGIVIVQHVDPQFAGGLAKWLGRHTQSSVGLAQEGERPQPGRILLAGREDHLVLASQSRLGYTCQPMDCSYRPSVDVFFKSLVRYWPGRLVAVLLTGMGRDGAAGLKLLRDHGHCTITQDQASSAVFGMPKAAMELNAATEILSLDKIPERLTNILSRKL